MHLSRAKRLVPGMAMILLMISYADIGCCAAGSIAAPVLKWKNGGCTSWCETGWYSSPAVADLDNDGKPEVIGSGYAIHVLDGNTGSLEWRVKSGHDRSEGESVKNVGRTWPGIVLADIDADGEQEIVSAHSGGWVSVYDRQGYFKPGWPKQPVGRELRGLSVSDLDADGMLEIIVTAAVNSKTNSWIFEPDGKLRAGWPQLGANGESAWGVFNDNAAVGDLDGDGVGEIVVPSDVHSICAYEEDGVQIPANAVYSGKDWGAVGIWEDLNTELRGWGRCNGVRSESYRANFDKGPAVIADMNGDGINEVVAVGNMYDCSPGYQSKYNAPFIFNADRSRFNISGVDWERGPSSDTGSPLSEDYNKIESNQPNTVVADLDGDNEKEILFPSYDGRLHAFWLDKSEHGNWPYEVDAHASEGFYRFASEPVVADLDNDGKAEVIFASWVQKGSHRTGRVHIVDYLGNRLHEIDLPPAKSSSDDWNGALAAPTLANIDSDADLELVLNTAHSGLVAYDLPGTANARIIWGTGRGNYQRDGYVVSAKTHCETGPVNLGPANYGGAEIYRSESTLVTTGNVVIEAGGNITFEASRGIELNNGFQVHAHSSFRARIHAVTCPLL
ncbi:FG-GAP repeat domain-containing protein [Thiolapillus sp.]